MAPAFDPDLLPAALSPLVERALKDVDGCEEAIEAIERHLASGDRAPTLLVALALLTYREAAELVLSQLEEASRTALSLLDEALAAGAEPTEGLTRLRALCAASLERERARERRLLARVAFQDGKAARPLEVVELAHRLLARGEDDGLAAELMRCASELDDEASEDEPPSRAAV